MLKYVNFLILLFYIHNIRAWVATMIMRLWFPHENLYKPKFHRLPKRYAINKFLTNSSMLFLFIHVSCSRIVILYKHMPQTGEGVNAAFTFLYLCILQFQQQLLLPISYNTKLYHMMHNIILSTKLTSIFQPEEMDFKIGFY